MLESHLYVTEIAEQNSGFEARPWPWNPFCVGLCWLRTIHLVAFSAEIAAMLIFLHTGDNCFVPWQIVDVEKSFDNNQPSEVTPKHRLLLAVTGREFAKCCLSEFCTLGDLSCTKVVSIFVPFIFSGLFCSYAAWHCWDTKLGWWIGSSNVGLIWKGVVTWLWQSYFFSRSCSFSWFSTSWGGCAHADDPTLPARTTNPKNFVDFLVSSVNKQTRKFPLSLPWTPHGLTRWDANDRSQGVSIEGLPVQRICCVSSQVPLQSLLKRRFPTVNRETDVGFIAWGIQRTEAVAFSVTWKVCCFYISPLVGWQERSWGLRLLLIMPMGILQGVILWLAFEVGDTRWRPVSNRFFPRCSTWVANKILASMEARSLWSKKYIGTFMYFACSMNLFTQKTGWLAVLSYMIFLHKTSPIFHMFASKPT